MAEDDVFSAVEWQESSLSEGELEVTVGRAGDGERPDDSGVFSEDGVVPFTTVQGVVAGGQRVVELALRSEVLDALFEIIDDAAEVAVFVFEVVLVCAVFEDREADGAVVSDEDVVADSAVQSIVAKDLFIGGDDSAFASFGEF